MVRRAASGKLGEFAAAIYAKSKGTFLALSQKWQQFISDVNMIKNEIVPLFRQLAKDDQDSVRLLTVGACVEIAKILSDDDIQNEVDTFFDNNPFLKAPEISY